MQLLRLFYTSPVGSRGPGGGEAPSYHLLQILINSSFFIHIPIRIPLAPYNASCILCAGFIALTNVEISSTCKYKQDFRMRENGLKGKVYSFFVSLFLLLPMVMVIWWLRLYAWVIVSSVQSLNQSLHF